MLESRDLLLASWSSSSTKGKTRRILDADGQPLGFADWRRMPFLVAFSRQDLDIFETEDASLVCVARRRWGKRWAVHDAEDRLVGACRRQWTPEGHAIRVDDAVGKPAVWIAGQPHSQRWSMIETTGRHVGAVFRSSTGTRIEFDATLDGNPFEKMVLLIAVILEW